MLTNMNVVNFFADPFAVKELLIPMSSQLGLPLERFLLLPLDITTPHELPFPVYTKRVDPAFQQLSAGVGKKPITHFTSSFLEQTREVMLQFGKDAMELHDIVAVWCAIANPPWLSPSLAPGWAASRRVFEIERSVRYILSAVFPFLFHCRYGELTRGMLVIDRREDESAYAPGANRAEVQAALDETKTRHGPWESTAMPAEVEVESNADVGKMIGARVNCVTTTPGPTVLLELLLQRVWGV